MPSGPHVAGGLDAGHGGEPVGEHLRPAEEWPEWSQPLGAHDAYSKGAKVSHNGKHWISDLDANVWEPGQYGWTEAPAEAQEE